MNDPELKLYACNQCGTVVAVLKRPTGKCGRMCAAIVAGQPNNNYPIACRGEYERIEELQITPIP